MMLTFSNGIFYYYTGRFIKNQQTYTKLLQLFKSAWRNKNTEVKEKNTSRCSLHNITQTKNKQKNLTHKDIQHNNECMIFDVWSTFWLSNLMLQCHLSKAYAQRYFEMSLSGINYNNADIYQINCLREGGGVHQT